MRQLDDLRVAEVLAQPGEEIVGDCYRSGGHADGVIEYELVTGSKTALVRYVGSDEELLVAEAPPAGDLRAAVDAVLALGDGRRLELAQGAVALVHA